MPPKTSQSSRKSSRRSSSSLTRFRTIKNEIRILGIDDGPFSFGQGDTILIGAVLRAGSFLDGVLSTHIGIDGSDATKKIIDMVNGSRHKRQLRALFLDGVTFGGFNVVDISTVNEGTGLPVIVVNRKMPDFGRIETALERFEDRGERMRAMKNAGPIKKYKSIYFQSVGLDEKDAKEILSLTITHGNIPEPLRLAHLIAGGVVRGESRGRA